tara:strand:+ start:339 stop:1187 length:849 start_codon:yes stop_codon:yes gene_type:complete
MSTNLSIYNVLAALPDNTTKDISPADVRQIVTSNYSPQLILTGVQPFKYTGNDPYERGAYKTLYYNPFFFEPAATGSNLGSSDQIWQITNFGTGFTINSTFTAIVKSEPNIWDKYGPIGEGEWEITTNSSGEIESYKIIKPATGFLSGAEPSSRGPGNAGFSYNQTGFLDVSGNTSVKFQFNGVMTFDVVSGGDLTYYTMSTNANPSNAAYPGQGSQAAANHTMANTSATITDARLDNQDDNPGIAVGFKPSPDGSNPYFVENLCGIRTDAYRQMYFQIWRV